MLFGLHRVAKNLLIAPYATLAGGLGCCELINSEAQEVQSLASNLVLVLISFGRSLGDLPPSCSSRHSGATAAESHCC